LKSWLTQSERDWLADVRQLVQDVGAPG
jgi:hypothetical protein